MHTPDMRKQKKASPECLLTKISRIEKHRQVIASDLLKI